MTKEFKAHNALHTEFRLFTDMITQLQDVLPTIEGTPEYDELVDQLLFTFDTPALYDLFKKLTDTYDLRFSA